jgi:hypothetical protein
VSRKTFIVDTIETNLRADLYENDSVVGGLASIDLAAAKPCFNADDVAGYVNPCIKLHNVFTS